MTPSLRGKVQSGSTQISFREGTDLTEQEQKYCRCVLKVATKQAPPCFENKFKKRKVDGVNCYNPYAVCTKSVGRSGRVNCGGNYDFSTTDDQYLMAYADLNGIDVPVPYNRQLMLSQIDQYKRDKGYNQE